MKEKRKDIVCRIPGGQYGNDVDTEPLGGVEAGTVVVDVKHINQALSWLRRRAYINGTLIAADSCILICYELRPKRRSNG